MKIDPEIVYEEMVLRNQAMEKYQNDRILYLAQTVAIQRRALTALTPKSSPETEKEDCSKLSDGMGTELTGEE